LCVRCVALLPLVIVVVVNFYHFVYNFSHTKFLKVNTMSIQLIKVVSLMFYKVITFKLICQVISIKKLKNLSGVNINMR
jgi:hypothetical protein